MKKRLAAALGIVVLIVALSGTAMAVENRSSDYLAYYEIDLTACGNSEMEIYYNVNGTGRMSKIGAQYILIEQYVNGSWIPYGTLTAVENPDFYAYNAYVHNGLAYFTGVPGVDYRVTLKALAQDSTGSDTGTITSGKTTCK